MIAKYSDLVSVLPKNEHRQSVYTMCNHLTINAIIFKLGNGQRLMVAFRQKNSWEALGAPVKTHGLLPGCMLVCLLV